MKRARLFPVAVGAAVLSLWGSACTGEAGSKAGGDPAPVTLRIGTADEAGRPGTAAIEEFARLVREASAGQVQVEPVWAAGDADDWDQAVARRVVGGDLEMGMIPARAWDTEGVTSLRALQAPFLVTSDELVKQVVTADAAGQMLAGLDKAGITGLALVPEGLRHVFSFGKPLLTPADFKGITVRVPRSNTTYALFEALGATADDFPGGQTETGVAAGTVAAAESSFEWGTALPKTATATGNLVPYPKVNTLVINKQRFAALSEPQRRMLQDAATKIRDWGVRSMTGTADAAARYCAGGGAVVSTTKENLAAFQQVARPVYADLEKDPQTKALIAQIRDLRSGTSSMPVAACRPRRRAVPPPDRKAGAFPDGVYRKDASEQAMLAAGADRRDAKDHAGIWTISFEKGRVTIQQRGYRSETGQPDTGVYCVAAGRITVALGRSACADSSGFVLFMAAWTLENGRLQFSTIPRSESSPAERALEEALFGTQPWERIG